jgi:hypothetical protein
MWRWKNPLHRMAQGLHGLMVAVLFSEIFKIRLTTYTNYSRKQMETTNIEVENSVTQETVAVESPQLYAGKYESIGELEKAYKNSSKVFNENKVLLEKLKSYEVPENYTLPEVSLSESVLSELQHVAKSAGLNQEQFKNNLIKLLFQCMNKSSNIKIS